MVSVFAIAFYHLDTTYYIYPTLPISRKDLDPLVALGDNDYSIDNIVL
jgi:hypothetical protein